MLAKGIIRKSNSSYNSSLWIVPKKQDASGKTKWRLVIDYRKLSLSLSLLMKKLFKMPIHSQI